MTRWRAFGAAAAGLVACAVLGWFGYVRGEAVPLLSGVDLGFHELGHLLAAPLPRMVMFIAGSATQVLVPLGLAAYFGFARREPASAGVMLAWAATSAQNVSVYVADAPYQRLQLIGGQHDWAYLLGPHGWSSLASAEAIAGGIRAAGAVALFAGFGLCLVAAWEAWGSGRPVAAPRHPGRPRPIRPVRHPAAPDRGDLP